MLNFVEEIINKAIHIPKTIVLPEGEDPRILQAAQIICDREIARLVLIGHPDKIEKQGIRSNHLKVIDPAQSDKTSFYAERLYEIRKYKGLSLEKAQRMVLDPIYFGTMMVKCGDADGLVAGASHSTGDTIRPALQLIRPVEGFKTVSSAFFMCFPDQRTYVFADCAIVENPTAAQLADIAVLTAGTAIRFGIDKPRIAMLSYSTKGSAKSEAANKVIRATARAKEIIDALFGYGSKVLIDGELQFDAAFVPEVAQIKCPNSILKGQANVFIFPDLEAGNICYKAVQRLAGAEALGPVVQGLAKPVNDLSRGCSVSDIVGTVAITAIQAQ